MIEGLVVGVGFALMFLIPLSPFIKHYIRKETYKPLGILKQYGTIRIENKSIHGIKNYRILTDRGKLVTMLKCEGQGKLFINDIEIFNIVHGKSHYIDIRFVDKGLLNIRIEGHLKIDVLAFHLY